MLRAIVKTYRWSFVGLAGLPLAVALLIVGIYLNGFGDDASGPGEPFAIIGLVSTMVSIILLPAILIELSDDRWRVYEFQRNRGRKVFAREHDGRVQILVRGDGMATTVMHDFSAEDATEAIEAMIDLRRRYEVQKVERGEARRLARTLNR